MNAKLIINNVGPTKLHSAAVRGINADFYGCTNDISKLTIKEMGENLNKLLNCTERYSFVIPGSGSTAMEMCIYNLVQSRDEVLVCSSGIFGDRMIEMFLRRQANVTVLRPHSDGEGIELKDIELLLRRKKVKLIAIIHLETSTGVLQPLEEIMNLARKFGAYLMVDMVSSLGGLNINLSKIDIDVIYSASQKCLSAATGLGIISLNERAYQYVSSISYNVPWCWDMKLILDYWKRGLYPYTTPIVQINALNEALKYIENVSYDVYYYMQKECGDILNNKMMDLGFKRFTKKIYEAPFLKVYMKPENVSMDMMQLKNRLYEEYNIVIANGLGKYKQDTIRIGTMGSSANIQNIEILTNAIKNLITEGER